MEGLPFWQKEKASIQIYFHKNIVDSNIVDSNIVDASLVDKHAKEISWGRAQNGPIWTNHKGGS